MLLPLQDFQIAAENLSGVAKKSVLEFNERLSEKYNCKVYFKREDTQVVRSFKIRGAYNLMKMLTPIERGRGVVCASAGNHAQGVAYSCRQMEISGVIFMPTVTPNQKIEKVKSFGDKWVEIRLTGKNYDDASKAAKEYCKEHNMIFVHAYADARTIAGQGTIGKEILDDLPETDIIVAAIGGGGLISGIGNYTKLIKPEIKIIGVEPTGATCMQSAFEAGKPVKIDSVDTFCDGVAVKATEQITFEIAKKVIDRICIIQEGHVAMDMIDLYQNEGIIVEPSGALAVSCLDKIAGEIAGKTVVCVICGGNNDISRYPEVIERSLVWQGRKHYFVIEFNQKPGQLKTFVNQVLGPTDDIVRFEYIKKTNKEKGAALVGVELKQKEDLSPLLSRFDASGLEYKRIKTDDLIYQVLV